MLNPILKNRKYTLAYFIVWLIIAIVQIITVLYFYSRNYNVSIGESLVFNGLFAIIGIGIWYPVYYTDLERNNITNFITNHIAACSLAVGLWLWIGLMILNAVFKDNISYLEHLTSTIPWKIGLGFLLYIIITSNYYLIIYYSNFKEKLVHESELKTLIKESELNSLKSQINPHFLFNSLNSISSLTMISPERAQDMVINLSEFLRYSLSSKNEILSTLDNELKNLDRYLKIEKIRFGKRLHVDYSIEEETLKCLLPGLILQPVIENAVKYGIYESIERSDIIIKSKIFNNILEITILNQYDPDFIVNKGAGIGLKNVKGRLKIQYSREDLVKIITENNWFKISLRFPQKG